MTLLTRGAAGCSAVGVSIWPETDGGIDGSHADKLANTAAISARSSDAPAGASLIATVSAGSSPAARLSPRSAGWDRRRSAQGRAGVPILRTRRGEESEPARASPVDPIPSKSCVLLHAPRCLVPALNRG